MWSVYDKAVSKHTNYERLPDGRWRGTFDGALDARAEGESPDEVHFRIMRALDPLVARWILTRPAPVVEAAGPVEPGPQPVDARSVTPPRSQEVPQTATSRGGRKWKPPTDGGDR